MKKIVYCVARDRPEFGEMALGLARSLSLIGDRSHRVIATNLDGFDWDRHFDEVVPATAPRSALDKLLACEATDADAVLSLDVDMLAFRPLDPIFRYCAGKSFTVQGYWDSEGAFHGKPVAEVLTQYGLERRFPRFNGGLAYYERGDQWSALLDHMKRAEASYPELGFETFRAGYASEEVCMLDAMVRLNRIDLIPMDLQFQHSLSGLVGPLNLDVLANRCDAVCKADRLEFAKPILFHAWRYKDFTVYWNELRKLRKAEERADGQAKEHTPRLWRLQRSIERRWMKYVRRWR